jgi:sugar O-acyltransferase (sialic acid O-acetyltransferase NeuD family)
LSELKIDAIDMTRVVIFGAGGHGREVAEVVRHQAQQASNISVLGFIVDEPRLHNKTVNDLPVLGDWSWFEGVDRNEVAIVCALGSPTVRKRIVERAAARGLSFFNAISPDSYLSPNARVGQGVMILPKSVVSTDTLIDDHVLINVGATISHDTRVGRFGTINPGVHLAGNVSVGEGCYLGMGCSVIQGRTLGAWTTVGAGAVVIQDLPVGVTAVGVPARIIEMRDSQNEQ